MSSSFPTAAFRKNVTFNNDSGSRIGTAGGNVGGLSLSSEQPVRVGSVALSAEKGEGDTPTDGLNSSSLRFDGSSTFDDGGSLAGGFSPNNDESNSTSQLEGIIIDSSLVAFMNKKSGNNSAVAVGGIASIDTLGTGRDSLSLDDGRSVGSGLWTTFSELSGSLEPAPVDDKPVSVAFSPDGKLAVGYSRGGETGNIRQ
jgi:hypothetical protein